MPSQSKEEAKLDMNDVRQKFSTTFDKGIADGSLLNALGVKKEAKLDLNAIRKKIWADHRTSNRMSAVTNQTGRPPSCLKIAHR